MNYFSTFRDMAAASGETLEELEKEVLAERGDAYDLHPPLGQRLRSLPNVGGEDPDRRFARELLTEPDQLEERLTKAYTRLVRALYSAPARSRA